MEGDAVSAVHDGNAQVLPFQSNLWTGSGLGKDYTCTLWTYNKWHIADWFITENSWNSDKKLKTGLKTDLILNNKIIVKQFGDRIKTKIWNTGNQSVSFVFFYKKFGLKETL